MPLNCLPSSPSTSRRWLLAAAACIAVASATTPSAAAVTLHVAPTGNDGFPGTREKPIQSLAAVRKRLTEAPRVTEVIFHRGVYSGGLSVDRLGSRDDDPTPLLLRAADGEEVIFDGAGRFPKMEPLAGAAGVFVGSFDGRVEVTVLWETDTRTRYTTVADMAAVRHFPGSFTIREGKLYLRTSDDKGLGAHQMGISGSEAGIAIRRSSVTVRGFTFRNYLRTVQGSTGVDVGEGTRNVRVENCHSINCSLGFRIYGADHHLLNCRADDVGNGVYVGGRNVVTEGCRLFRTRDAFMVPVYSQDDSGIQYYGGDGLIRGNLCVGFDKGVFLKSSDGPHRVEHNTLVCTEPGARGDNWGLGNATTTAPDQYQFNIIAGFAEPFLDPKSFKPGTATSNCVWIAGLPGETEKLRRQGLGDKALIADPRFVNPDARDYRLALNSPCLELVDAAGPCGAFPAARADDKGIGASTNIATVARRQVTTPAATVPVTPRLRASSTPQTFHLSPDGVDADSGTADKPWRTLQHAVDQALPGDTVLLKPGIYAEATRLTRGGTSNAPIIIRAEQKWQAILDGNRRVHSCLSLVNAPFVEIRDLEIRWFEVAPGSSGIHLKNSPNVTVAGCKIWNDFWSGWPMGKAVNASHSPGFVAENNLVFRQEIGFYLYACPGSRIVRNTGVSNLYGAVAWLHSLRGSVCRNNSFTYNGNDMMTFEEGSTPEEAKAALATFDCDYNNYATELRAQEPGAKFDSVPPRERILFGWSKAIIRLVPSDIPKRRFISMDHWRAFSGKDTHSIFADPLHLACAEQRFELHPQSANIGAGENGSTIGCDLAPPSGR